MSGSFESGRLGVGRGAAQQDLEVTQHPPHRTGVEQLRAILQAGPQASGILPDLKGQVELRRAAGTGQAPYREAGQSEWWMGRVLQREHHLEEGIEIRHPLGLQLLHQLLEGNVLVGVGVQRHPAHPSHQLTEGGITRKVGPERKGVDEEPDQVLQLAPGPVGDRRPDRDVALSAVARQERLQPRQQRHERCSAFPAAQRGQCIEQAGRELQALGRAPVTRCTRPRTIGRQVQGGRRPRELTPPVGQLALQHLALEPVPLPDRIVAVLHRQLRQAGGPTGDEGTIELAQLAGEYADRPSVHHDVMERDHEHVLVGAPLE